MGLILKNDHYIERRRTKEELNQQYGDKIYIFEFFFPLQAFRHQYSTCEV